MKHLFSIVFLLFITVQCSIGQHLTKSIIDEHLNMENDERTVYVVNGIPYCSSKIDSLLSLYPMNHLLELMMMDMSEIFCSNKRPILIVFAQQQGQKEIRKSLKEMKKMFKTNSLENSVFYIDNEKVNYNLAKQIINELSISDIYHIHYFNESQNTKNSFVQIWTKSKDN